MEEKILEILDEIKLDVKGLKIDVIDLKRDVKELKERQDKFEERQIKFEEKQSKFEEKQIRFEENQSEFEENQKLFAIGQNENKIAIQELINIIKIQNEANAKAHEEMSRDIKNLLNSHKVILEYNKRQDDKLMNHEYRIRNCERELERLS